MKELYIGIMSGTSLDGIDVVLCEIDKQKCTLLFAHEHAMPLTLKEDILTTISGLSSLESLGSLDHRLGLLFCEAVTTLLQTHKRNTSDIKAIGLHGQTLWHAPQSKHPFSMQLGDPNILTATLGIPVVADFRRKDIALGGEGAPFAPAFHAFMFNDIAAHMALVNIGGMANITILASKLLGYDTGCGNVLLDLWIHQHKNLAYDAQGKWAKSGKLHASLLKQMLDDAYFDAPYPKSTGREKFNATWLNTLIEESKLQHLPPEDIQRTLLELTAVSIANELKQFKRKTLLICGGGAKNTFLLERLAIHLPELEIRIAPHADDIEAMTFAWLAYKRIHLEEVALKEVTGARKNTLLGGLYA